MSDVPNHFYRQSGVIPFRIQDGVVEVLLITSSGGGRWVIPKGVVEPDLSPAESAAKEALEEAGVDGQVQDRPIGAYQYEKWGGVCTVEVFPLQVTCVHSEWLESHRRREWLRPVEAAARVREPELQKLLRQFTVPSSP